MPRTQLLLILLALGSAHAGLNDLNEKDSVDKKDRDKKDFHRYEDWGMDWSDADMMQHPIDEGPRRVRPNATLFPIHIHSAYYLSSVIFVGPEITLHSLSRSTFT